MIYANSKTNAAAKFVGLKYVDLSKQRELGIALMDDEQKLLFYHASRQRHQMGQASVMSILALLGDYADHHFLEEEAQMAEFGTPIDESHHQLHLEFRKMMSDLKGRAHMMKSDEVLYDIKQLINGWLYHHIIMVDFKYISHDHPG